MALSVKISRPRIRIEFEQVRHKRDQENHGKGGIHEENQADGQVPVPVVLVVHDGADRRTDRRSEESDDVPGGLHGAALLLRFEPTPLHDEGIRHHISQHVPGCLREHEKDTKLNRRDRRDHQNEIGNNAEERREGEKSVSTCVQCWE